MPRATRTAPRTRDIIQVAMETGSFNTLAAALKAAGLMETLRTEGPFTVFAPTDDAFAWIPRVTLDALLADKPRLRDVLLYHVVPGTVTAADVVKMTSATTANGQPVRIQFQNSSVFVDKARVMATDIAASNGVIHIVDAVIFPE